ncbi:MAG: hypothetical protein LKF36_12265 [Lactobacillus sp.]|jgi:hypothetical protein|nr:hypothetical protein [Lactobacillus sp.]
MKRKPAYVLVLTLLCLSFTLWLSYATLAHYKEKMMTLQHFNNHAQAAMVYNITRPHFQKTKRLAYRTNLGTATYQIQAQTVACTVKLQANGYSEVFRYIPADAVPSMTEPKA